MRTSNLYLGLLLLLLMSMAPKVAYGQSLSFGEPTRPCYSYVGAISYCGLENFFIGGVIPPDAYYAKKMCGLSVVQRGDHFYYPVFTGDCAISEKNRYLCDYVPDDLKAANGCPMPDHAGREMRTV